MNSIALPQTAAELVEEYQAKQARISDAIASIKRAKTDFTSAVTVGGTYVDQVISSDYFNEKQLQSKLLKSGWQCIYNRLGIADIATAKDIKLFEQAMADPPELTLDTVKATFGSYFTDPREHMLRGLAEAFVELDPAYKSHSKVTIGVKGLPKKVIIHVGEYNFGYGWDRMMNVIRALKVYQEAPQYEGAVRTAMETAWNAGEDFIDQRSDISLRRFQNGNVHVIFGPIAVNDIKNALAEYYGTVLPDAAERGAKPSTAVSKDLQFYRTPPPVIDKLLDCAGLHGREYYHGDFPVQKVLEPSCGEGDIMDAIVKMGHFCYGIEYDYNRFKVTADKGHHCYYGNFLECVPSGVYDHVVMNPPFYGKHYEKHIRHALKFLRPGGQLTAVLPATARYDHGLLADLAPDRRHNEHWRDLPVGSFASSGTRIPTVLMRCWKPKD